MSTFEQLLAHAPAQVGQAWFAELAEVLLNQVEFMIAGQPHRFVEIEFYYHGEEHCDPFAHCDPVQQTSGIWYFHREGGGYRSGSFKGLDISFGPEGIFGGILIRTIAGPDGSIINGSSLCVDHMLALTGAARIADLDNTIQFRKVWDTSSPLHLRLSSGLERRPTYATARVGLTLKRLSQNPTMPPFLMRDYRFLTDPTIKKGKVHTIITLLKQGMSTAEIRALTNSPTSSIIKYQQGFDEGQTLENFTPFRGKALKVEDLCLLHGLWHRQFGM